MTSSPVKRLTRGALDGSFGPDRNRRIVVSFIPGNGDKVADLLSFRPLRTRRAETLAVPDCYRLALRFRVQRDLLERARIAKDRKATRLAAARQQRAEKRLIRPL